MTAVQLLGLLACAFVAGGFVGAAIGVQRGRAHAAGLVRRCWIASEAGFRVRQLQFVNAVERTVAHE